MNKFISANLPKNMTDESHLQQKRLQNNVFYEAINLSIICHMQAKTLCQSLRKGKLTKKNYQNPFRDVEPIIQ